MIFYEIEMLSVPDILFACSVETKNYCHRFNCVSGLLELAVCESGKILLDRPNESARIVEPGMLIPIVCTDVMTTASYDSETQRHSTVGVRMQYNMTRHSTEAGLDMASLKDRMKKKKILLVPYLENLGERYDSTLNLLKKISSLHLSENPADRLGALSQWYALGALFTDFVLDKTEDLKAALSPAALIYAGQAQQYIRERYMYPLSVREIADAVGISEGYLHRIFRDAYHTGIAEYINRHRIFVAISLMENKNLSLTKAAANVGIEDPAYMSRLFKKVTGMSCRNYFAQKRMQL